MKKAILANAEKNEIVIAEEMKKIEPDCFEKTCKLRDTYKIPNRWFEMDDTITFEDSLQNYLLKICKQDGRLLWVKPHIPAPGDRKKVQDPLRKIKLKRLFELGERFFLEAEADMEDFLEKVQQGEYMIEETNIGEGIFKKIKDME